RGPASARCGAAAVEPRDGDLLEQCWREADRSTRLNLGMYNAETLLDIHQRAHESLRRLIAFCSVLTDEELGRPLAGFGFPTIQRQLAHTIGGELYWQTVVTTGYSEEATLPAPPDLAAIEAFRPRTAAAT